MGRPMIVGGLVAALAVLAPSLADARARPGPYPNTATNNAGTLIFYTGRLSLTGRTWGQMDQVCAGVPVPEVPGWRAPTMAEIRTLIVTIPQDNGIRRWNEDYIGDEWTLAPAITPYSRSAEGQAQMNVLVRDLWTYDGQSTTLAQARPGRMYILRWLRRWTTPVVSVSSSIRYAPADYPLGPHDRLLCVADL